MSSAVSSNGSAADSGSVDLHLLAGSRWCALDLDELLEQIVLAGCPCELIATNQGPNGRRRYMRRALRGRPKLGQLNHDLGVAR
jgi:hypothetical protein